MHCGVSCDLVLAKIMDCRVQRSFGDGISVLLVIAASSSLNSADNL